MERLGRGAKGPGSERARYPRHFGISAKVSVWCFVTSAELSGHVGNGEKTCMHCWKWNFNKSKWVRRFLVSALNVQTQGAAAQLTKHKRFHRSFELAEGDVRLPKLFRQTVPQHWPGGSKNSGHWTGCVTSWPGMFDCLQTTEDGGQRW